MKRRLMLGWVALGLVISGMRAAEPIPPPAPPLPVSPIATFRGWLAMGAAEREAALATRPEAQRAFLASRLAEYEGLSSEAREERLHATDLYWHLQQLIRRSKGERDELIAAAPEGLRGTLRQRMEVWDGLSAGDRADLLEHERVIRYLARVRTVRPPPLPVEMPGVNVVPAPVVPLRLQAELKRFQELPVAGQERMRAQWRVFVEGTPERTERVMRGMTESERREMAAVLERFRDLTPNARQACIDGFARFARMDAVERAEFLRNAERWGELGPQERETWRRLVTKLPPLPPVRMPIVVPPLPPVEDPGVSGAGM